MPTKLKSEDLLLELTWLKEVLRLRLDDYFSNKKNSFDLRGVPLPELKDSPYDDFVKKHALSLEERVLLILALIPHIHPQLLDYFFLKNNQLGKNFTEFGGVVGEKHRGFIPTGETFFFIVAGGDLSRRFSLQSLFDQDHLFWELGILIEDQVPNGEPKWAGKILLSEEYLHFFTRGKLGHFNVGLNFPADEVKTNLEWDDLVLDDKTKTNLEEIITWVKYGKELLNDARLGQRVRPGYRSLFVGPSGTGKTMAASLLGKTVNKKIYRIDLSMLVSKYIGETEKMLKRVFDFCEKAGCLLFFDEADSIFGKRTAISHSNDRYANQEVSYLLQRMESYNGVLILASNFRNNIDEAFIRRFESVITFTAPKYEERLKLWEKSFPANFEKEKDVSLDTLAKKQELNGAQITNVLRYASLAALAKKSKVIEQRDLLDGIVKEFHKEGKTIE